MKDRNTGQIIHYNINIGGRKNKCIQLNIPSQENIIKYGKLIWVLRGDDCAIDVQLKDKFTQHSILLGFTIARNINPSLQGVYLDDDSTFNCKLPNGHIQKVSMREFHIAFHKCSWYEYYFDAKLTYGQEDYESLKKNFYDPSKKPADFYFLNEELHEVLNPIYQSTRTWDDFFQKIKEKYGEKRCAMVYPWLTNALHFIFESKGYYENTKWMIDFAKNELKNKTPHISFTHMENRGGGRGKKTRKNYHYEYHREYHGRDIPMIQSLPYKAFVDSNNKK
jgi:hypothetical protein